MSNTTIAPKPLTKNDVTLEAKNVKIVRGDWKGHEYPIVGPTVVMTADGKNVDVEATRKSLLEYITFRGEKNVVKYLLSIEKADGQQALSYASETEKQRVPNEKGELIETEVIVSVNPDKYYEAYLSDTMRGGTTIKELENDIDEKNVECQALFMKMTKASPAERGGLELQITELIAEIQNLTAARDNRRREPRKQAA